MHLIDDTDLCDDMGKAFSLKEQNETMYEHFLKTEIKRWIALDSDWENLNIMLNGQNYIKSKKENFIRMEQGTAENIIDVEKCKEFCDQTPICQYFFISKDGKCILYQSCKIINTVQSSSGVSNQMAGGGLEDKGHTFEKGIVYWFLDDNESLFKKYSFS